MESSSLRSDSAIAASTVSTAASEDSPAVAAAFAPDRTGASPFDCRSMSEFMSASMRCTPSSSGVILMSSSRACLAAFRSPMSRAWTAVTIKSIFSCVLSAWAANEDTARTAPANTAATVEARFWNLLLFIVFRCFSEIGG